MNLPFRRLAPYSLFVLAGSSPASAQVHCESVGSISRYFQFRDVSADGSVLVGGRADPGTRALPYRWKESGGPEFLEVPLGTTSGYAVAVSDDGTLAVGDSTSGQGSYRALRWDASGTLIVLEDLTPGEDSRANAISGDGSVVVGSSTTASGRRHAVRWVGPSAPEDLGTLGGIESYAWAVNHDGTLVVGGARVPGGSTTAFRWTPTLGMVSLGFPGSRSQAILVSSDSSTIIGTAYGSELIHWTAATGPVVIARGVTSGSYICNVRVSADGSAVIWEDDEFDIASRGYYYWSPATGVVSLDMNISLTGISEDGTQASGARRNSGSSEPIVWSPTTGLRVLDAPNPGSAVAVTKEDQTLIGVIRGSSGASVIRWREGDEIGTAYCGPTVPNSTGEPATLAATGTNIIQFGTMSLAASQLPANVFGLFLTSRAEGDTFPVGNSQGRLCLGGEIGRFAGQVLGSGTSGQIPFLVPTDAIVTPTGLVVGQPGETWNFQLWFRDANPLPTSNFTNGVSVTLR